jgi:methionine aminopeptidase
VRAPYSPAIPAPTRARSNRWRTTSEETRAAERLAHADPSETYEDIRRAAEVHRQARQAARAWIRPGRTMTEIAEYIEDGTRALVEEQGLDAGVGFPTGLSLNHCAAHYTPNAGDTVVLKEGDVLKVDIGVHVKGRICDSAFTLNFGDPAYDKLLEAVKAATETGIRVSMVPYSRNRVERAVSGSWHRCQPRRARRADPGDDGVLRGRGERNHQARSVLNFLRAFPLALTRAAQSR